MLPFEKTQTYSQGAGYSASSQNNPIRVDPLTVESVTTMINGKRFKVRSLIGRFFDISQIFVGMKLMTRKLKCKILEGNKGSEHVFNPMGNFKSNLCYVTQYPIVNIREVHIPLYHRKWKLR
jgi:hypothetical protein